MKGTGAKRNVCPGSCVSTGAKFPVAPVESAPMPARRLSPVSAIALFCLRIEAVLTRSQRWTDCMRAYEYEADEYTAQAALSLHSVPA